MMLSIGLYIRGGFIIKYSCLKKEFRASGVVSICFLVLLTLLLTSSAFAQDIDEVGTIITSNPPGATICLNGEYLINATTPCRLPDNINGLYKLKAKMTGYESWSGEIMIVPGQNNSFSFSLSSKNRYKAALRSMFFPGWGQYYSDQRTKGIAINLAALGFGLYTIKADNNFRSKRDDYLRTKLDLENAVYYDDVIRLRKELIDKNREAYDAESARNTLIAITVGIYVYNILDAIIFFPERKLIFQGAGPKELPKVEVGFDGETVKLQLTAKF